MLTLSALVFPVRCCFCEGRLTAVVGVPWVPTAAAAVRAQVRPSCAGFVVDRRTVEWCEIFTAVAVRMPSSGM
jgi:hypothetical protein